jgi:hypothetical protein
VLSGATSAMRQRRAATAGDPSPRLLPRRRALKCGLSRGELIPEEARRARSDGGRGFCFKMQRQGLEGGRGAKRSVNRAGAERGGDGERMGSAWAENDC